MFDYYDRDYEKEIFQITNFNKIDSYGNTLLHKYKYCSIDALIYLIKNGVNVNATNNQNRTFLYEMNDIYSQEFIEILFEKNYNFNHQDNNGNTIFHFTHNKKLLKECIKRNAFNLDLLNNTGKTIFHNDIYLIDLDNHIIPTNINHQDNFGNTIFHTCYFSDFNIDRFLYALSKGFNPNLKNIYGNTIFHLHYNPNAIFEKIVTTFISAINAGFDINSQNSSGDTIFHDFSHQNIYEIMEAVKFNVNLQNKNGETVFHLPMKKFDLEKIINLGFDINTVDNRGNTIFHKKKSRITKNNMALALQYGLDPNIQNKYGNTLLHLSKYDKAIYELLSSKKTNVTLINKKGKPSLCLLIK